MEGHLYIVDISWILYHEYYIMVIVHYNISSLIHWNPLVLQKMDFDDVAADMKKLVERTWTNRCKTATTPEADRLQVIANEKMLKRVCPRGCYRRGSSAFVSADVSVRSRWKLTTLIVCCYYLLDESVPKVFYLVLKTKSRSMRGSHALLEYLLNQSSHIVRVRQENTRWMYSCIVCLAMG